MFLLFLFNPLYPNRWNIW